MTPADSLKLRQEAGAEVERKMIDMLLQYGPARDLKVGDVKLIAATARNLAFDEFSDLIAAGIVELTKPQ